VTEEVGEIIVADVSKARVQELASDTAAVTALIKG
jgi:hypothetical protein